MVHAVPSSYTGESVRSTIQRLYGQCSDVPVTILHATVPPVAPCLYQQRSDVLNSIFHSIQEQLYTKDPKIVENVPRRSSAITDHWLLSVPESLRYEEAAVVNYLGMMVAIDFCHWAEVPRSAGECVTASVGEEVTNFAGFYAVVEPFSRDSASVKGGATVSASVPGVFVEPSSTALKEQNTLPKSPDAPVTLLRGSAAMMYLLHRAVEVHHIPWYDPNFLQRFHGDTEAAMSALRVCFLGCEEDGITPLWMPCTRERVELLLSLADAFNVRQTSYHALLRECGGFMFAPEGAGVSTTSRGFVPALVHLHPRYCDFAYVPGDSSHCFGANSGETAPSVSAVPVLKLSQLTALAIEQALPDLWRYQGAIEASAKSTVSGVSPSERKDSWLTERAARFTHSDARTRLTDSCSPVSGVFSDHTKLSICCDYQIPKTLRAAGLLLYDDHLARVVDRHVLLSPGSAEEVSIRVATLVAADRLLEFINAASQRPSLFQRGAGATASGVPGAPVQLPVIRSCNVNHLDYALWYVGRSMFPGEARHHLCRTIMY
ncbi:hypothetical protein JKF63_00158 [Porcisia hertigi]|uniref:Queuosine 5'-phosphate N-glycosylase/hydrolase n=1 Tax=Porcisia hertigi TaxID=2761500 RepID=A0A836KWW1_9TRYP|nr:hypothetical protein JKF63_00158 [Porcisia hertigi]